MIILPCIPEEVFILVANMITLFTFRFSYLQCCCWYFLCFLHWDFSQSLLSWWFDFFFPLSSIFYFEDKVTFSDKLCASVEILNSKSTPISCTILSMSIGGSFFDIVLFHEHCWLRYQLIEMKCSAKYMPNVPVSWNISCDEPSVIVIKLAVIEKLLKNI